MESEQTSAIDKMTGVDSVNAAVGGGGGGVSDIVVDGNTNTNNTNIQGNEDNLMITAGSNNNNNNDNDNDNGTNGILTKNGKTSDTTTSSSSSSSSSLDVDLFNVVSGGNGNGDDSGTISQIVGQLKTSIESSLSTTTASAADNDVNNNSDNKITDSSTTTIINGSLYNDDDQLLNSNNNNIDSIIKNDSILSTNNVTQQQIVNNNNFNNEIKSSDNNNQMNNHVKESNLNSEFINNNDNNVVSTSLPSLSSSSTTTPSTTAIGNGKRILLSANSPQPVNSTIIDNTTTSSAAAAVVVASAATTTIVPAPAITTKIPMAQKSASILNLQQQQQQTNGGQQSSIFLQQQQQMTTTSSTSTPTPTTTTATTTIRTNHVQMPQVSLSNSIVLDPRTQQQQQQLTNVSTHNPTGSNLQFQIVNVNNPSRNQLTVPTAVSAPAGYAVSNIITGTNATTIQAKTGSPQIQQPRLVQIQNSQVRLPTRASSFAAPLTFPAGLVRGQTIFVKTENGQMHMVNVGPQALAAAAPQTVAGHQLPAGAQLRLQVSAATPPGTANVPTTGPNVTIQSPAGATIRTQLAGNQIVLPATLATAAGVNTQVATIPANKVSQLLPQQMIAGNVALPTPGQITPIISSSTQQSSTSTQSSPVNAASIVASPTLTSTAPHPPLRVHTTAANSQSNSTAPSQMSPTTAKMKCKNFLSTLIRLASEQPESVATNVKTLIQGLIDDTIQPEDFTTQLQRELNSSEQPCLVPFLKKSLPYLRYSLMKEELKIDGVQPPPPSAAMIFPSNVPTMAIHGAAAATQNLSHIQNLSPVPTVSPQTRPPTLPPGVRLIAPGHNLIAAGNVPVNGAQIITSLQPPTHHQLQQPQPPTVSTSNHHHPHHPTPQHNSLAPIVLASPNHHPHGHQHPSLISMSPNLQTTNTSIQQHSRLPTAISQHSTVQPIPQTQQTPSTSIVTSTPSIQTTPVTSTKSKKSSFKTKTKLEKFKKDDKFTTVAIVTMTASSTTTTPSSLSTSSIVGPSGERVSTTGGSSSSFRDDDDINDVAAMGGVNLAEESQRILAGNAEIIGQQIRSCKDEPFLYISPLQQKLNKIVKRYDLEDCSHDVVALVSHAAEERLKTLVERLGAIAEHRQENLRNNSNYEIIQDVKAQAQFLQELDRIEKRRHEEQEREVLIKAAKSRSKVDDPDHIAIKAKAKEMQRLEMEELRQREANKTALQAIGYPKKRLKTSSSSSLSSLTTTTTTSLSLNSTNLLNDSGLGSVNNSGGSSFFNLSNGSKNNNNSNNLNKTNINNNDNNHNDNNNNNTINTIGQSLFGSSFGSSRSTIKRLKRVNMKDVLFMMERDRTLVRSTTLFKAYAR